MVFIVGLGGSVDPDSQSERALRAVLGAVRERGATVQAFTGAQIDLPPYHYGVHLPDGTRDYIEAVRRADGVVLASPAYHGTLSGLVKNAVDYLEELAQDGRPYLSGRAVAPVAVAKGWQAAVTTLGTLRQVVHALRGWPTPVGLAINGTVTRFEADGSTPDETARQLIGTVADQLIDFADRFRRPN